MSSWSSLAKKRLLISHGSRCNCSATSLNRNKNNFAMLGSVTAFPKLKRGMVLRRESCMASDSLNFWSAADAVDESVVNPEGAVVVVKVDVVVSFHRPDWIRTLSDIMAGVRCLRREP